MNKRTLITIIPAAALLLLAACTQDEPGGQGNELPYGEYPLQISGVTLDVESSAEPWSAEGPQTRVTEDNTDGKSSVWEWNGSEMIGVRLGNETATYTLSADKNLITDRQLYWTSTAPTTVTAWYPTDETVNLSDQSEGLAYMLKAEVSNATYNNEITLGFKHQLAKVRVVLNGTQAALAQSVEVYGYTTCTNNEGAPVTDNAQQGWLKMKKQTYGNTECWEANVVPGDITPTNFIRINGQTATINENFPATLASGNMYTIDLTVGEPVTEITADNCNNINDDGYYRVSDQFNQQISITGGKPTIYLESANINVGNGPAINITNGTPTIHVTGENTIETSESLSNCSAGIYVAEGSSVTIEGSGTDDVLQVTGGADGAAIGGYSPALNSHNPCGDITIHNVTLYAYASNAYLNNLPIGIGSTGTTACGKIEITDAIVHAQGYSSLNESTPAIGAYSGVPQIVISGSTIHAHRGSYGTTSFADYIGRGGNTIEYQGGQIQCGSGSITGSTVYKYSYDVLTGSSSDEGTVVYDASGNATEQPQ
ncbi:fimbrillin family protein [Phocaeicola barnesiae]